MILYVPGGVEAVVEIVRLEPPVRAGRSPMLLGARDAVAPEGETATDRLTVPEKSLTLNRVIVDIPEKTA
jgi:hypothetical protein